MKTTIINENQRGFLFKNGKFERMLLPGKYRFFGGANEVTAVTAAGQFRGVACDISVLLTDEAFKREVVRVEVADETLVLHYINGRFDNCLTPGEYAFWKAYDKHEFREISTRDAEVSAEVPRYLFEHIQKALYKKAEVAAYQKGLLYLDQKFVRVLDEGTYYFWSNGTKVEVILVDTRLLQMDITGQEVMTLDKVGLRINFVAHYRITDVVRAHLEVENLKEQLHILIQMALREYVGKYRLDEILENKDQIAESVFRALREKEAEYFVAFADAGVKDIVLPGEIKNIMNTVLMAEKRAQANVITRREEVASTRSLLNTAKLMDENQTLYKLKELEYLEKICENVGNITVSGGSDLLSQLTAVLKGA